jgi:osmotically-inducible protein OsmY
MGIRRFLPVCGVLALSLAGCTQSDQKAADARTAEAERKIDHAGEVAKRDAAQAGQKLDHAALLAKVKAKLATDAGLRTVSTVDVDLTGDTVTLRGTVSSPEQKQSAERAAAQVDGIAHVINQLTVQ